MLELHHRGDRARANELYTDELKKYIVQASKTMSSKQRILCSIAHYKDNAPDESHDIYTKTVNMKDKYLLLGEVETDLDLMHHIIHSDNNLLQ